MENANIVFNAGKFQQRVKALPIILLLDVSGSMGTDGKIEHLNEAVIDMLDAFSKEMKKSEHIYKVAIITFGTGATILQEFGDPDFILNNYKQLTAGGQTYLGAALETAKTMIEDKNVMPSYWYRPAVLLLSDGHPYGENSGYWKQCMDAFCNTGRSGAKTQRFAIALGKDASEDILAQFTGNPDNVLHAEDASEILKNFREVTLTVAQRFDNPDPNQFVPYGKFDFDNANKEKPEMYRTRRKPKDPQRNDGLED